MMGETSLMLKTTLMGETCYDGGNFVMEETTLVNQMLKTT
jgi:hypothetical protein